MTSHGKHRTDMSVKANELQNAFFSSLNKFTKDKIDPTCLYIL